MSIEYLGSRSDKVWVYLPAEKVDQSIFDLILNLSRACKSFNNKSNSSTFHLVLEQVPLADQSRQCGTDSCLWNI